MLCANINTAQYRTCTTPLRTTYHREHQKHAVVLKPSGTTDHDATIYKQKQLGPFTMHTKHSKPPC